MSDAALLVAVRDAIAPGRRELLLAAVREELGE